jgi:hypothetical protein
VGGVADLNLSFVEFQGNQAPLNVRRINFENFFALFFHNIVINVYVVKCVHPFGFEYFVLIHEVAVAALHDELHYQ